MEEDRNILKIKENSAVQAHISMLQGIINRLSEKSANCKNWCVGIISAIFILLFSSDKININENLYWIYYAPIFLFLFLNCYYLGQERLFVKEHKKFVSSINDGAFDSKDIFGAKSDRSQNKTEIVFLLYKFWNDLKSTLGSIFSFSILIFYGASIIIVKIIISYLINNNNIL